MILHTQMKHDFKSLVAKIATMWFLHPLYSCSKVLEEGDPIAKIKKNITSRKKFLRTRKPTPAPLVYPCLDSKHFIYRNVSIQVKGHWQIYFEFEFDFNIIDFSNPMNYSKNPFLDFIFNLWKVNQTFHHHSCFMVANLRYSLNYLPS